MAVKVALGNNLLCYEKTTGPLKGRGVFQIEFDCFACKDG